MGDLQNLEARLASLQRESPRGSGGSHPGGNGLKERLEALSGVSSPKEGRENQFNSRLAALTEEGAGGVSSAEDLAARLERLGGSGVGGVGVTNTDASAAAPGNQQQYGVPEDCSDDWQDLDDLLEATLDRESPISTNKTSAAGGARAGAGSQGFPEDEVLIGNKLSEMDALLKSEANASSGSNGASAAVRFEQEGMEADKVMEAFLGGRELGGAEESDSSPRRDHLGHEEERLLEMMTEQVRLEGHGLIARTSTPAQEESGELWLPLAPTALPVARPGVNNPRNIAASLDSRNSPTTRGEAARLLAQQAMDEARLSLGGEGGASSRSGGGVAAAAAAAGRGAQMRGSGSSGEEARPSGELREESPSWCCICSEDAALRCRECEAENGSVEGEKGGAEPEELFCARCFKEIHREDPDMKTHRPQALSGAGARGGGRSNSGGGRRGWRFRR